MAFRSKLEEKVAALFDELGVEYEYESEKIPYVIHHIYTPDFLLSNGTFLETKGYWDAPLNTISKRSKTTYAQYCDKLSIPWTSFKNIPIDWLT